MVLLLVLRTGDEIDSPLRSGEGSCVGAGCETAAFAQVDSRNSLAHRLYHRQAGTGLRARVTRAKSECGSGSDISVMTFIHST